MVQKREILNPYVGGALAGALAVASVWVTGKFFGASTTFVRAAGFIEKFFNPFMVARMDYYIKEEPKIEWQWMFVTGALIGSFLISLATRSFAVKTVPEVWRQRFGNSAVKRAVVAFCGGIIAMIGARLADGCPSGHGLSGMMQLSVGSLIAMACFFAGGIAVARLLYAQRRKR
ncbi:MAG TPA: YeeE/YedE thiosulfate transporter family protein [Candidatus Omnitrophota bacterium]|nr:YeeE/YedE thiosulfate transporter family protein [Candidatus Omnitrophota bacterium]HQJ14927.1 YeeE/YedE thiosulfate transporter family protein [Candidatus Omnitrophota bacterium]